MELVVKNPPAKVGDKREVGSIPESGRSPGEGHGNPFQYSCLENPMDRGAWWAAVHRITKSWTRLSVTNTLAFGFMMCSREIRSIMLGAKTYVS